MILENSIQTYDYISVIFFVNSKINAVQGKRIWNVYHEHAVASATAYGISRLAALKKMFRPFTGMVSRMG